MLIDQRTLAGIVEGRIGVVFRRWDRPRAVPGGRQRTAAGELRIDAVEVIADGDLTDADAHATGLPDLAALRKALGDKPDRQTYRVRLHLAGPDPRAELRERADLGAADVAMISARLARLDKASSHGPWTASTLALVAGRPGVRAPDLAASVGRETAPFKIDVRKLKELGLTESLAVGYRISPRGAAYLHHCAPEIAGGTR
ncbi:MAG: hypothetical protein H0T85_05295 [Geodermatophilaceae bacterium]|nr:hypothetical protein [Geodermatophilaceae bacterium]